MTEALLRAGAKTLARTLRDAGHEAYFAGGCVRDVLLGKSPKDFDIATDATPEEVQKIFRRTVAVGAAFGVIRVRIGHGQEYEVATYRTDGEYTDGRRPDVVRYSKSKEEDVARRDFTINALLMDPFTDEILDFVGGQADLARRMIRAVGDPERRFFEDKLRMLRAVRFASRFDFEIDSATRAAIQKHASSIVLVSAERIVTELSALWNGADPGLGMRLLAELELFCRSSPSYRPNPWPPAARGSPAFPRAAAGWGLPKPAPVRSSPGPCLSPAATPPLRGRVSSAR